MITYFQSWKNASPYNQKIYDILKDASFKFTFKIDPNIAGLAGFMYQDSSLVFRSVDGINDAGLWEELFHAYQHHFYPGGLEAFVDYGRSNIEFEAKLYRDMLLNCCSLNNYPNIPVEILSDYEKWVNETSDYQARVPNSFASIQERYWYFLDKFVEFSPYNYPLDYHLPDAMFHLFND